MEYATRVHIVEFGIKLITQIDHNKPATVSLIVSEPFQYVPAKPEQRIYEHGQFKTL